MLSFKEILKLRELTDKPFAVNLSLNPTLRKAPNDEFVQVIVEEHVKIAEVSGARSPVEVIPVKEVIDSMVNGAEEIHERLTRVGLFKKQQSPGVNVA